MNGKTLRLLFILAVIALAFFLFTRCDTPEPVAPAKARPEQVSANKESKSGGVLPIRCPYALCDVE